MNAKFLTLLFFLSSSEILFAQDTVIINSTNLRTDRLKESVNRYLIYTQDSINGPKKNLSIWTRVISNDTFKDKNFFKISQVWESNDTIMHKADGYFDKKDFSNVFHSIWWKQNNSIIDFDSNSGEILINKRKLPKSIKDSVFLKMINDFEVSRHNYFLNWHYDLEIFSMLPYKLGRVLLIPFYEPGFSAVSNKEYIVGKDYEFVTSNSGRKIKCWILEYTTQQGLFQKYWIAANTFEVLKLEEKNNNQYRFKVKLIS